MRLTEMKNSKWSGQGRTMPRGDHWVHTRSKLPVKKESICGTGRRMSSPRSGSTGTNGTQPSWHQGAIGVEPIFPATPPLEALRVPLCDACRAHFYDDAVRDVFVRLPNEDPKAKGPGVCGTRRKTTYGSLDAAQRRGTLEKIIFGTNLSTLNIGLMMCRRAKW